MAILFVMQAVSENKGKKFTLEFRQMQMLFVNCYRKMDRVVVLNLLFP